MTIISVLLRQVPVRLRIVEISFRALEHGVGSTAVRVSKRMAEIR